MSIELGTSFAAKLEPFLLMAKSAKGAAAAKLVQDATAASGVFVFAELLDQPNIKELATSEQHAQYYSLLQLFSYKTYQDYLQHKDVLPSLNQAQITKLKHLSLVSLAMERRILPYSTLLQALDMATIRELEDLIIDAVYMDVIRGKLDQKEQQFEVEYTMGRDLEPGKVEGILAALQDWASTTASVLATLDNKLASLSSRTAAKQAEDEEYDKTVQNILKEVSEKQKENKAAGKKVLGMGSMQEKMAMDSMDVDEPVENIKGKNRKATAEMSAKPQRKRNRF
ncbi:hypothetical protein GLOTRDRAFT_135758 [Gloeophyllum trabeum ATCC 11539]|uniref:PCI domain-containing protein n=1 Tax=Gloeophyllum trabeum (strain ATCC 11539 / FP-39264 / Madison 617) TaxID=670483 RepID=S7QPH9_GLOTA|nr:uncharacterized protein GLOTRDRAFT_135758 [Gloeophyllum trabeum ATCC 11539]EPQ61237.1 hypothetical protein GLOTRDRAFT_135758 [Gloeophyllum trabeum ATCC 11539]